MFVWVFGQIIGQGVVEEKASRIIEGDYGNRASLQLLWGKIIGIGAVAFLYMLIAVVAADCRCTLPALFRMQYKTR